MTDFDASSGSPRADAAPRPSAGTSADRPVAVVTGATGGMGRKIVADLAADHEVFALGRDAAVLEELADRDHVTAVAADLVAELVSPRPASFSAGLAEVLGCKRVDVLVHGAAVARRHTVATAPVDQWRAHLDLNVLVPAELTRRLLPALRAAEGTVVFINSGAGDGAHPGNVVYAASKHALRALADGLRKEEEAAGVRVSTVAPGPTDTAMLLGLVAAEGQKYRPELYIDPLEVAAAVRAAVAAGPTTQLTEIAVRPRVELADR